jgi:hypothetical protein
VHIAIKPNLEISTTGQSVFTLQKRLSKVWPNSTGGVSNSRKRLQQLWRFSADITLKNKYGTFVPKNIVICAKNPILSLLLEESRGIF